MSAEQGIICSLLVYPHFYFQCPNLKEHQFYDKQNAALYWAIEELVNKGIENINENSLMTQLSSDESKSSVLGNDIYDQLAELVDNAGVLARGSEAEYKALVERVIGLGFKRDLYQNIKKLENRCLTDSTNDISSLNSAVTKAIDDVAVKYIMGEEISNFGDKVDQLWNRLLSNRNDNGTVGYSTGYKELDKFFTYRKGELTVIMAHRKHGKSVVGMNAAYQMMKAGLSVVYFDTEMKDDIFFSRLISHMTGIPENNILSGCYSSVEEQSIKEARDWIKSRSFIHEYDPSWTRDKVVATCKVLKNQRRLDFFIYDYLKDTGGSKSSSEVYLELGNWCNDIKNKVCGALDIPGLTFAQLNRSGLVGDSFKIEQYVTTGCVWRPKTNEEIAKDTPNAGNYCMQVQFNRIGDSHNDDEYIDFVFKKSILTVEEAKFQHKDKETPYD